MSAESYRFQVGEIRCLALNDGTNVYTAANYFPSAGAKELAQALSDYGLESDRILSPYTCLAAHSAGQWVLVDTGAGSFVPTTGRLPGLLRSEGISPEEISIAVITHAHPDHIGGITLADGRLIYPNARWVMARAEWEFWRSPEARKLPPIFSQFVEKNLPPIEGRVTLVDREVEVAPGIYVEPAPGHTPGHAVVSIRSAGDELLYISDTVLHPIHLEHPTWQPIYDMDQSQAARTVQRVLDRAADNNSLVLAFHFPFPSLGRVIRQGGGWKWQPVEVATQP